MTIEKLKKEFPGLTIVPLNCNAGVNISLPRSLTLTIWFKKRKFFSNKTRIWRQFADDTDLICVINTLGNLQMKQHPETKPVTSGVQNCINHVKRKYERYMKANPNDYKTGLQLKILIDELEQYL